MDQQEDGPNYRLLVLKHIQWEIQRTTIHNDVDYEANYIAGDT